MLDQLIERSRSFESEKADYGPERVALFNFNADLDTRVRVDPHHSMFQGVHPPGGYEITNHAFRQVCRKLGRAVWPGSSKQLPVDYLMACPPQMRADQLNYWRRELPLGRQWFVRTYKDECRAVLTNRYSVVDVTETLEWVQDALDSRSNPNGYQIMRPTVTPDVLYLRVGERNVSVGDSNVYAIGAIIITGETGNRGLAAYPFIQRISCDNSIYVPLNAWSFESKHVGNSRILRSIFTSSIFRALEGSVEALDRLLDAKNHIIDNFAEHVDKLVEERGWSTVVHDSILLGSEGHETLFGAIQGISAAAREVENVDVRVDMEMFAGSLLTR